MGVVKRIIPRSGREKLTDAFNRLPTGIKKVIPSAITIGSMGLTEYGVRNYGSWRGVVATLGSRVGDDIDGDTARALDAATKLGANLDAIKDKYDVLRMVPTAISVAKQLEGKPGRKRRLALGFIGAKHALNAGLNLALMARGAGAKSQKGGKLNMFADSVALISFAAADSAERPTAKRSFEAVGYGALAISVPLEAWAVAQYAGDLLVRPDGNSSQIPVETLIKSSGDPWIDASFGIAEWPDHEPPQSMIEPVVE